MKVSRGVGNRPPPRLAPQSPQVPARKDPDGPAYLPLLAVVEGSHDVEFLTRISRLLHGQFPALPDLGALHDEQRLVFLPVGGGSLTAWPDRLAGLGKAEFHLYDREMPPESELRSRAVAALACRPRSRVFLTQMRSLENYLHPTAIEAARGHRVSFGGDDNVADLVAAQEWAAANPRTPWSDLPLRARKRFREKTKRWLNSEAVERMTFAQLQERDPRGEVYSWLAAIRDLLGGAP